MFLRGVKVRLLAVVLLASCGDRSSSGPANLSVSPTFGPDDAATRITIEGDFSPARLEIDWEEEAVARQVEVELGGRPLLDLAILGRGRLEGVVPTDMPHGWMPLVMTDPSAGSTVLERGFCVLSPAAQVRHLALAAPSGATTGEPISLSVTAERSDGTVVERFDGRVRLVGVTETSIGPFEKGRWYGAVTPNDAGLVTLQAKVDLTNDPSGDCAPPGTGETSVDVAAGAATAVHFAGPLTQLDAGQCSADPLTVELRDDQGTPLPTPQTMPIELRSWPDTITFFDDPACTAASSQPQIRAGDSSTDFWLKGERAGVVTVDVGAVAAGVDSRTISINPGPPTMLAFSSPPQRLNVGECSRRVSFETQDAFGNPSPVAGPQIVSFTADSAAGISFFLDPACVASSADVPLGPGDRSGNIYFSASNGGMWAITATSDTLATAQQTHTIADGTCGDGRIDPGETCDDGNGDPTDGCASCQVANGWSCLRTPSECYPTNAVAFVDDDTCPQSGLGTETSPFCEIGSAVASGKRNIFVLPGTYPEAIVIDSQDVNIVGKDGVVVTGENLLDTFLIKGTSTVRMAGLEVSGFDDCIEMNDFAIVELFEMRLGPCVEAGVDAENSSRLLMDRTFVSGAGRFGVSLADITRWRIQNSILAENGGIGIRIVAPYTTPSSITSVTVANNADEGILCTDATPVTNVISWGNEIQLGGPCMASYSDVDQDVPGTGNLRLDPQFTNDGTYHLQASSPCIDAGAPLQGLGFDFDGDPRPLGLGVDIGADEAY